MLEVCIVKKLKPLIKYIPIIAVTFIVIVLIITIPRIISETTKHTHIYGDWEKFRDPSCYEQGIDIRYCECGSSQQRTIEKLEHIEGEWRFNEDNSEKHLLCSVCNRVIKTEKLDDHTHSWGEWIIQLEPSCTDGGLYVRTCRCGAKEEKAASPKKHNFSKWEIIQEPTCTEEGLQQCICKACGEIKEEVIDVVKHSFGEWVTISEPTCVDMGLRRTTCECGETKEESIPVVNHSYSSAVTTKLPTCTEDGKKESTCSICDNIIIEIIPKKNQHSFGSWEIVVDATCSEEGVQKRICDCGAYEEKPIAKTNDHNYGAWEIVSDATCGTDGIKRRTCVCGIYEEKIIYKTNAHIYGEWEILFEATTDSDGEKQRICGKCGDTEKSKIPALEYDENDWTISDGKLIDVSNNLSGDIVIPSAVQNIEAEVFRNNRKITSVEMTNVESIGKRAFSYCNSLSIVYLPSSLTSIGKLIFDQCSKLTEIYYDGTIDEWKELTDQVTGELGITCTYTVYCNDGEITVEE